MERRAKVPREVTDLLAAWRSIPAFVRDEHLDVLASNPLAQAVSAGFTPGVNLARFTFLNQFTEDATSDWPEISAQVIAILHTELQAGPADDAFRTLIGDLAVRSQQFSSLWADERGTAQAMGTVTVEHPMVGPLQLTYQTLGIPGAPELSLVVWTAAPGSARQLSIG